MLSRRTFLSALAGLAATARTRAALRAVPGPDDFPTARMKKIQPSSSATKIENLAAAGGLIVFAAEKNLPGWKNEMFFGWIEATGSMRPAFGDGDVVIFEKVPYAELQIGDIIRWHDAAHPFAGPDGRWADRYVTHRIVGGKPGAWITRGDNNQRDDDMPITPERYVARVRAVFYSRKSLAA